MLVITAVSSPCTRVCSRHQSASARSGSALTQARRQRSWGGRAPPHSDLPESVLWTRCVPLSSAQLFNFPKLPTGTELCAQGKCIYFCRLQWASQMALMKPQPANEGGIRDEGSIPGSGRSSGGGQGNPLQHSCLEKPMDRRAWWATAHRVAESDMTEET